MAILVYISLYSLKWVQIHGTYYNTSTTFIVLQERVEEDLTFGKVQDIIFKNGITFHVQRFKTIEYNRLFNCYIISETEDFHLIPNDSLSTYISLHQNYISSNIALVLKYYVK